MAKKRRNPLFEIIRKAPFSRTQIILCTLMIAGEVLAVIAQPLLTKTFIDRLESESGIPWIILISICIALVLSSALGAANIVYFGKLGQRFATRTRKRIFGRLIRMPVAEFEKERAGESASRLLNDTRIISSFVSVELALLASSFFILVGSLIQLALLDVLLTAILFVCIVVGYLFVIPLGDRVYSNARSIQSEEASLMGFLSEVFSQIRLLKTFGAERMQDKVGGEQFRRLEDINVSQIKSMAIFTPVANTIISAALMVVLCIAAMRMVNGSLSLGSMIAYVLYLFYLITPVELLSDFIACYSRACGSAVRLHELEELKTEDYEGLPLEDKGFTLRIKDLSFAYPDQSSPGLTVGNLTIPCGKVTAIVGQSGAGKSTLFALLNRLYESEGIFLNEKPLQEYDLLEWRNSIANVAQDAPVVSGSVRWNLNYGSGDELADGELIDALKAAKLWSFLEEKNGLETHIGENAVNLSGGQKQRLAIARALLRKPKLLLLDEATAALDAETEYAIQEELEGIMRECTTVVISHKLDRIRDVDQIVLLGEGKVEGVGTHEELASTSSSYQDLISKRY